MSQATEPVGVPVRADLLLPAPGGWTQTEVKSLRSIREYQLSAVAIQRWVMDRQGQGKDRTTSRPRCEWPASMHDIACDDTLRSCDWFSIPRS